jgi:hypothetical protein
VATGEAFARAGDEAWRVVAKGAEVRDGDRVAALAPASLDVAGVRVTFRPDLSREPGSLALEAVVRLDKPKEADAGVQLERGRIDLQNVKERGPATVRLKVGELIWVVELEKPGSRVALELVGRWPVGTRFKREPGKGEAPTADLYLLVQKGAVTVKEGGSAFGLSEPPGPAYFHWDSLAGTDPGPSRLEKLPTWAEGEPAAPGKEAAAVLSKLALAAGTKGKPTAVLLEAAGSDDPAVRHAGLAGLSALDDIAGLHDALTAGKTAAAREAAVPVLRHWIGTGPGQDQALFQALQKEKGYKPVQAATVVQLLHGFSAEDLRQLETFEALIAYLESEKPAVRELAAWQLNRLTPAGKDIKYDSTAPAAERAKAAAAWRKLLDDGKLR